MSGADLPYQLRPRKFVDRQIFLDALVFVDRWVPLAEYAYVSLGGRFLDDLRAVHSRFGIEKLVSLESTAWVYKRQQFNTPLGLIELRQQTTREFIDDFDGFEKELGDKSAVVWLDYTEPSERQAQLRELQELVGRLDVGDVFKITINANPTTLVIDASVHGAAEKQQKRLEALRDQLGDYLPGDLAVVENMTHAKFPRILAGGVRIAVQKALQSLRNRVALPLAVVSYQDSGSHTMLTAAGIVMKSTDVRRFSAETKFEEWEMRPSDWTDVKEISIPDLSVKERYRIHEQLFSKTEETLHNELPFRFSGNEKESLEMLRDYARHYRRYPSFARLDF